MASVIYTGYIWRWKGVEIGDVNFHKKSCVDEKFDVLWRSRETFGTSVCFMWRMEFRVCLLIGWFLFKVIFSDRYQCYGFLGFFGLPFLPWNGSWRPKVSYHQWYIRSWLPTVWPEPATFGSWVCLRHGELRKGRGGYMHNVTSRRPILLSHNLVLEIIISDF